MVRTVTIQFEASPEKSREIIEKISLAAVKSMKSKGMLVGIKTEEPQSEIQIWENEINIPGFIKKRA